MSSSAYDRDYSRRYRKAHHEETLAALRRRRAQNPAHERASRKARSEYLREWKCRDRALHPEKYRAIWAAERVKYRMGRITQTAAWRDKNRDHIRSYNASRPGRGGGRRPARYATKAEADRAWRVAHVERKRALDAAWKRAHPERCREYALINASRRRALKNGNGGSHTVEEWRDKCALLGNVCIYCGEAKPLTRDHKIPLTRGGSDDITNIVPACRPCNTRKLNRTAHEFLARKAAHFGL